MSFFKRILLPMILLLVLACAFLLIALLKYNKTGVESSNQTENKKTISNLTNISPADYDSVVKSEYALASSKAKESNQGNTLSAIDIEVGKDLVPSSVISRYVFTSPADTANNWTMTFTQVNTNFVRASIPKEDYLGNTSEINTKLWKFNFVTALQIAEKNGGLTWRESNNLRTIRLTLRHVEPKNWLLWIVQYKSDNANLLIKIDANSGRIVTDDDSSPDALPE